MIISLFIWKSFYLPGYLTQILTVVRRISKLKRMPLDTYRRQALTGCIWWHGSDVITKIGVRPSVTTIFNRWRHQWRHHPGRGEGELYTRPEKSSFNRLVFTTTGGMAPECNRANKRLAEKIAEKRREPNASVITPIRTKLRFVFLLGAPLLQYEDFEGNEVMSTSKTLWTLTSA